MSSGLKITDVRLTMDAGALAAFFATTDGQVAREMLGIGSRVERLAKRYCAVDTGRLRASITTVLASGGAVYVGTDVEYAARIEYGFSGTDSLGRNYNQSPQSYLRRALTEVAQGGG